VEASERERERQQREWELTWMSMMTQRDSAMVVAHCCSSVIFSATVQPAMVVAEPVSLIACGECQVAEAEQTMER